MKELWRAHDIIKGLPGVIKGHIQEALLSSAKHFPEVAHQLHGFLSSGLLSLIYLKYLERTLQ